MSHFTVTVIGNDIEAALQPFHEFECTGVNDQYVQDIDRSDEARKKYAEDTSTRIKAPDGTLHSFFNEQGEWRPEFSQVDIDAPSFDRSRKTYYVPPGYEKVEVPTSQVQSFANFAEDYYGWLTVRHGENVDLNGDHKYGYLQLDAAGEVVKCIDRTNPNKQWDWYQIGGRWSGKLILKNGQTADSAPCGQIDWAAMQNKYAAEAAEQHDKITRVLGGRSIMTWADALAKVEAKDWTIQEARDAYHAQETLKELLEAEALDMWDGAETLSAVIATEREEYIKRQSQTNATTWALLHNGEWTERGNMGWWGMSDATEGSTASYVTNFWMIIRDLPEDMLVTVVDCHI